MRCNNVNLICLLTVAVFGARGVCAADLDVCAAFSHHDGQSVGASKPSFIECIERVECIGRLGRRGTQVVPAEGAAPARGQQRQQSRARPASPGWRARAEARRAPARASRRGPSSDRSAPRRRRRSPRPARAPSAPRPDARPAAPVARKSDRTERRIAAPSRSEATTPGPSSVATRAGARELLGQGRLRSSRAEKRAHRVRSGDARASRPRPRRRARTGR